MAPCVVIGEQAAAFLQEKVYARSNSDQEEESFMEATLESMGARTIRV
jgi:hypothetical protein